MATATTTEAAIRTQMVTIIRAITPASTTNVPFQLTQTEMDDFREYADFNDGSVLREFEIELESTEMPGVQDLLVQFRVATVEIVVAYPHEWGLYEAEQSSSVYNKSAMKSMMEKDMNSIMKAVGKRGGDNALSGQHGALEEDWAPEPGEGVTFGVVTMRVPFYYDAT